MKFAYQFFKYLIVLFGGLGSGYGIKQINHAKKHTIWSRMKLEGFVPLDVSSKDDSLWNEIASGSLKTNLRKPISSPTEDQTKQETERLKKKCKGLYRVTFSTNSLSAYKDGVKHCSKRVSFVEKSKGLGLSILSPEIDFSKLKTRWTLFTNDSEFKTKMKSQTSPYDFATSGKENYSDDNAKELLKICSSFSDANKDPFSLDTEKNWPHYLLLCAKSKSDNELKEILKKSYWIN